MCIKITTKGSLSFALHEPPVDVRDIHEPLPKSKSYYALHSKVRIRLCSFYALNVQTPLTTPHDVVVCNKEASIIKKLGILYEPKRIEELSTWPE